MKTTKITNLTEEELGKISAGEQIDVSQYSEEELAQIFDLYFQMYGQVGALPYLSGWGVTTGDYYLMSHKKYWMDTNYYSASDGWRLAHLVYKRKHS